MPQHRSPAVASVYGSMLVGATHPYLDPLDNATILGQEFEFSWVIEERELFGTDARTVHAFKSPMFRLPDPDPGSSSETSPSRLQLQIEVPPFLTDTDLIPCRVLLLTPVGDLIEAVINGHPYILRNRCEFREHIHFMIAADIQQKTSRRSKFYAYEFHLRIGKEEMEWNAFSGLGGFGVSGSTASTTSTPIGSPATIATSSGGVSGQQAMDVTANTAEDSEAGVTPVAGAVTRSGSAGTSGAPVSLRLPPSLMENDEVILCFRPPVDQLIMAKKSILCSQSERFRELMNEMTRGNRLKVPAGFSFETMREVVRFLQSGVCENWEDLVEEIAEAAFFFKIDRLQQLADHKRSLIQY